MKADAKLQLQLLFLEYEPILLVNLMPQHTFPGDIWRYLILIRTPLPMHIYFLEVYLAYYDAHCSFIYQRVHRCSFGVTTSTKYGKFHEYMHPQFIFQLTRSSYKHFSVSFQIICSLLESSTITNAILRLRTAKEIQYLNAGTAVAHTKDL